MGKIHDKVIEMIKGILCSYILLYILLYYYTYLICSGNSHVALTLLCRSLGSNGTKQQHTIGLSPPMAAGAAKGRMYMCNVYYIHTYILGLKLG